MSGLRVVKQIESVCDFLERPIYHLPDVDDSVCDLVHLSFGALNSTTAHEVRSLCIRDVKKSDERFNGTVGLEGFLRMRTVTWDDFSMTESFYFKL